MIIKVRHRYAVTTLYTPNVRRNHLELQRIHGNTTASNAHVAVTLHDRLVLLERHGIATTPRAYIAFMQHDRLVRQISPAM